MKKLIAAILCFCLLAGTCVLGVSAAEKVYSLTMGVHKYSTNTPASDIATVTYVRQKDGSTGSTNRLYDIEKGEVFTVTTTIKPGQEQHYAFIAWLDENGVVVSTDTTIELTMDSSKTVFATYTEVANRHVVYYSCNGVGTVSASSSAVSYPGQDCISVLEGSSVTFKFTPSKDYYASVLKVDGTKVSMLGYFLTSFQKAINDGNIKNIFNSVVNYVKFLMGKEATYTIDNITSDTSFEVTFARPYFS